MPIGVIGIQTNQKRDNGAPFPAGAANNGLSVDPISGKIVLGNNAGAVTAALLSNREIPINGFYIDLTAGIGVGIRFQNGSIEMNTASGAQMIIDENAFQLYRVPATGPAALILNDGTLQVQQGMDGTGVYVLVSNVAGQFGSYDVANGNWQVGLNPGFPFFNGAKLEVVGNITYDIFVNNTSGAVSIDRINDRGKLFTNENGASTFQLPTVSGADVGVHFMFATVQSSSLTVVADAGNQIEIGNVASLAGGNVTTSQEGSALHLILAEGDRWIAMSAPGAWTVN